MIINALGSANKKWVLTRVLLPSKHGEMSGAAIPPVRLGGR